MDGRNWREFSLDTFWGDPLSETVKYDTGGLGHWVHQLEQRTARNKVVVAIANKLARITWAVLFKEQDYQPIAVCAQA